MPIRFRGLLPLAFCTAAVAAAGEPRVPPPDAVLLERAAISDDPRLQALRGLRARLERQPGDEAVATAYARAAVDLGRDRGDPRYFGFAQSALAPWDARADVPDELRLLRATLAQREHRFDDARRDLAVLVARRPEDGQSRLMLAVMDMVQGTPYRGIERCRALAPLVSRLVAATCAAQGASLVGNAAKGQSVLMLALALDANAEPDVRRWSLTVAAEIAARQDDEAKARRLFDAAFALEGADPLARDVYLRSAWADFLLARGESAPVLQRLAGDTSLDPLLLRLAIAERQARRPAFAPHRDELAARFDLARQRGDALHLRDEARFRLDLLDDADGALGLALQNWAAQQREPADAELVLRAAQRTGRREAAEPVTTWMRETGIADPALAALALALAAPP